MENEPTNENGQSQVNGIRSRKKKKGRRSSPNGQSEYIRESLKIIPIAVKVRETRLS